MSEGSHELEIQATESNLGVALPYMREMARVTPELLARLGQITGVARYPRHAPPDIRHLAALGATVAQDCGPCVQIGVNLALAEGVEPRILQSALGRGGEKDPVLTESQADAFAFGMAVTEQGAAADRLRERLRERYGDAGVVSLSWAVAVAQFYPVLKRAMGFAESCSVFGVTVET